VRILLTGGAGYVGSACFRWLVKQGHEPIAYDDLSQGNAPAVPGDCLVVGDIADRRKLASVFVDHGIEAVMHFAAVASVPESIQQPELYYRINVVGTKCVLDAMSEAGVKRIVFSSTAATYGFNTTMPIHEDAAQIPETPYGSTKLAAEWMIREYAHAYGMGYAVLRYFNAAGADLDGMHGEDRRHESHLIPLILLAAVGRHPAVKIFGENYYTPDGTCVRDYIHVSDLAQAHQLAVEAIQPGFGEAYNLGSGHGFSVLEVLDACEKQVGHAIPRQAAPRRAGDPPVLVASSRKITDQLGWSPRFSDIEQIVATAWQWHRSHPDGYGGTSRGQRSESA